MVKVVLNLVKQELPTAILEQRNFLYRDLGYFDVLYVKDNKYFLAQCYYTPSWIAPTPRGPSVSEAGFMPASTLADVAVITEIDTIADSKRLERGTQEHLEQIYAYYERKASEFARQALRKCVNLIVDSTFTFTPVPMVIVALADDAMFLGSVGIYLSGQVIVITRTSIVIDGIVIDDTKQYLLGE